MSDSNNSYMGDNIQVSLRIKPLLSNEEGRSCIHLDSNLKNTVVLDGPSENKYFTFDYVATDKSSQDEVFNVIGKQQAYNCLEGYNGCIFAYGQTGAGKTYTMLGNLETSNQMIPSQLGLLPRLLELLYERIFTDQQDIEYLIKCSYLEIYNEHIIDLLNPTSGNLQLREDLKKGVYVESLSEECCTNYSQSIAQLQKGNNNRHIAATNMNIESSRSHSVFTVHLESKRISTQTQVVNHRFSRFHFVDLAGSERQKFSQAQGDRLKEGCNINKSLHILGKVINSLVEDNNKSNLKYVHYRDSKLTFLLKDSLGGNSRTHLIAMVQQSVTYFQESLSTLQFSKRVKQVKNKARINEDDSGNLESLKNEIKRLKMELAKKTVMDNWETPKKVEPSLVQSQHCNKMVLNDLVLQSLEIESIVMSDQRYIKLEEILKCYLEQSTETETSLHVQMQKAWSDLLELKDGLKVGGQNELQLRMIIRLQQEQLKRVQQKGGVEEANWEQMMNQLNELTGIVASSPLVMKTFEDNLRLKEMAEPVAAIACNQKQLQTNLLFLDQILETTQLSINERKEFQQQLEDKLSLKYISPKKYRLLETELEDKERDYLNSIQELDTQLKRITNEQQATKKENESLIKVNTSLSKEIEVLQSSQLYGYQYCKLKLEDNQNTFHQQLQNITHQSQGHHQNALLQLDNQIINLNQQLDHSNHDKSNLQDQLTNLQNEFNLLDQKTEAAQQELGQQTGLLKELKKQIRDEQSSITRLSSTIDQLNQEKSNLQAYLTDLKDKLDQQKLTNSQSEMLISQLNDKLQVIESQMTQRDEEIKDVESKRKLEQLEYEQDIETLEQSLEFIKEEASNEKKRLEQQFLEAQNNILEEMRENQLQVIAEINQQADKKINQLQAELSEITGKNTELAEAFERDKQLQEQSEANQNILREQFEGSLKELERVIKEQKQKMLELEVLNSDSQRYVDDLKQRKQEDLKAIQQLSEEHSRSIDRISDLECIHADSLKTISHLSEVNSECIAKINELESLNEQLEESNRLYLSQSSSEINNQRLELQSVCHSKNQLEQQIQLLSKQSQQDKLTFEHDLNEISKSLKSEIKEQESLFKEFSQQKIEEILLLENQLSDQNIQIEQLVKENGDLREENVSQRVQMKGKLQHYQVMLTEVNAAVQQIKADFKCQLSELQRMMCSQIEYINSLIIQKGNVQSNLVMQQLNQKEIMIEDLNDLIQNLKKELTEKERDFKTSSKQLFEEITELRVHFNEEKRRSKQLKIDLDQQTEMNDKTLKIWQQENERMQASNESLLEAQQFQLSEIEELEQKLNEERSKIARQKEELHQIQSQDYPEIIKQQQAEISNLLNKREELQNHLEEEEAQHQSLSRQYENATNQYEQRLSQFKNETNSQINHLQEQNSALADELKQAQSSLDQCEVKLEEYSKKEENYRKEIKKLTQFLDSEIKKYELSLQKLQEKQKFEKMEQKETIAQLEEENQLIKSELESQKQYESELRMKYEQETGQALNDMQEKQREEIQQLEHFMEQFELKNELLQEELRNAYDQNTILNDQFEQLNMDIQNKKDHLSQELSKMQDSNDHLIKQITNIQQQFDQQTQKMERIQKDYLKLNVENKELKQKIAEKQQAISDLKEELNNNEETLQNVHEKAKEFCKLQEKEINDIKEQYLKLESEHNALINQNVLKDEELEADQSEKDQLILDGGKLREECAKFKQNEAKLRKELQEVTHKYNQLFHDMEDMQKEINGMAGHNNPAQKIRYLNQVKQENSILKQENINLSEQLQKELEEKQRLISKHEKANKKDVQNNSYLTDNGNSFTEYEKILTENKRMQSDLGKLNQILNLSSTRQKSFNEKEQTTDKILVTVQNLIQELINSKHAIQQVEKQLEAKNIRYQAVERELLLLRQKFPPSQRENTAKTFSPNVVYQSTGTGQEKDMSSRVGFNSSNVIRNNSRNKQAFKLNNQFQ